MTTSEEQRPVTAKDVARHVGVSQSTVSLAMSGSSEISEATRLKVLSAAAELGYRPQVSARRLRTGRSNVIGVILPTIGFEAFSRILNGVRAELEDRAPGRYTILVGCTHNDEAEQKVVSETIDAADLDGVILVSVGATDQVTRVQFKNRMVLVEDRLRGIPSATYDLDAAMSAMIAHLGDTGHRRIAHFSTMLWKPGRRAQRDAFDAQLATHVPDATAIHLETDVVSVPTAADAAVAVLEAPAAERPTAVVCDDGHLAAGVYAACERLGLDIPGDVSVVCSHLDSVSDVLRPVPTGTLRPAERIGSLSAALLLDRLEGKRVRQHHVVETELRLGDSVAPPLEVT